MRPRTEALAGTVVHRGVRAVPATAQLFRFGERILAAGGGTLVEVDVDRPPEAWAAHSIPEGLIACDSDEGSPLLVADDGRILRLQPDISFAEFHASDAMTGEQSAFALSNGSVLVLPARRVLFGTYLFDGSGRRCWRVRADDPVLAAFDDVVLSVGSGAPTVTICRDTKTGDTRWRRRGRSGAAVTLVAVIDDAAWLSDGTALVSLSLEDGEERTRIDPGVFASRPRLDPEGRAHLLFGALRHWLLDLCTGNVVGRLELTGAPPRDPYPMEPLAGGAVLARDRAGALYRFDGGEGEASCPSPLWHANALPVSALVHRGGLLVLVDPSPGAGVGPANRSVHWLAPR